MLEFLCIVLLIGLLQESWQIVDLITDLNRKEGIKKASDCTCGKSQEKGKCGVEQGKECN